MAFKIPGVTVYASQSPETLFRDLKNRKVEGLLSQQADILRAYMTHKEHKDIALELPTGSGKTLVGLLIAEWRRRNFQERCVYLCPTRQLVHQVVAQAHEKYGIKVTGFVKSQKDYSQMDISRFIAGETVAITTYNSLFNVNTFFNDAHTLIFDDAHSAENYVSSFLSLDIKRSEHSEMFNSLLGIIDKYIPEYDRSLYEEENDGQPDSLFVNKLPTPILVEISRDILAILDSQIKDKSLGDVYYKWINIRKNIIACQLYYSMYSILIRPIIPPTNTFLPFIKAKQRIYMSATLGEGGDLERIFGQEDIYKIEAPEGWDKQGIGRRFIVFPMNFTTTNQALTLSIQWIKKFGRALILTPSSSGNEVVKRYINNAEEIKNFRIFEARDIEKSKTEFVETDNAIAILANRYDGIDFIGDECRYLILYGLPESTNLQERFFISRFGAAILFSNRIKTRITQAIGRCTRSSTDYTFVVIIGSKIHEFLYKKENRECFPPEAQAEIRFGMAQSAIEDNNQTEIVGEIEENIDHFISHDEQWELAENAIINLRDNECHQSILSSNNQLAESVRYEVRYQTCLWNSDYQGAITAGKDALSNLSGDELRGYRALWFYLLGNAYFMSGEKNAAKQSYDAAACAAERLPWLRSLSSSSPMESPTTICDPLLSHQIEAVEFLFERFGKTNSTKIRKFLSDIRTGLEAKEAAQFEPAQEKLGQLLGFTAENSTQQGAPDPWWFIGQTGVVFEDYTDTKDNAVIPKNKVLQAKAHPDYLHQKYPNIKFQPIFCARTKTVDSAAIPHLDSLSFVYVDDFYQWAKDAMVVMRQLWDMFSGVGDLTWREKAMSTMTEHKLDYKSVIQFLTEKSLSSLIK